MHAPKISVLMPIFNAGKDLHKAIDSIINQSFKEWELIIVDDGSTDDSHSIVSSFNDSRIRLIKLDQNGGIVKALNIGWDLSRGIMIARMDGDDICQSDRLEKQFVLMQQENLDICGSHWLEIDDEDRFIRNQYAPTHSDELIATLASTVPFAHGSVMFRKEFFDKNKLRYSLGNAEDYRLWIECFQKGAKFGVLAECLYHYRIHPHSITRLQSKNQANASKFLRRNFVRNNQDECLRALIDLRKRFYVLSNLMQIHALYLAYQYGNFFGSYTVLQNMFGMASWYIRMRIFLRILRA